MTDLEKPYGAVGDLAEELVLIATDLILAAREEGVDAIRGALLRVQAIEAPPEVASSPGRVWGAFAVVLAAMVDPEVPIRRLLDWTDQYLAADRPLQAVR